MLTEIILILNHLIVFFFRKNIVIIISIKITLHFQKKKKKKKYSNRLNFKLLKITCQKTQLIWLDCKKNTH